jgi:uncharacterized Tic20 family protein
LAALTHLLALFTGIIGPVIVYAVTDDPFLKANAANATDWQIMLIVYSFSSFILTFIFAFIFPPLALIAILFLILILFANFILVVVATIKAANGEAWSYPITPGLL